MVVVELSRSCDGDGLRYSCCWVVRIVVVATDDSNNGSSNGIRIKYGGAVYRMVTTSLRGLFASISWYLMYGGRV
jgi:hypothetical protein